jgi:dipeptidase
MPDPTGSSAIWVAQRVPDTHVAVVANMFTIRLVNLTDTFNFLGSDNIFSIAEQQGLWNSSVPFDWTATYSAGEYGHRYYSGRRMWRFLSLATDIPLPDSYDNLKTSAVCKQFCLFELEVS